MKILEHRQIAVAVTKLIIALLLACCSATTAKDASVDAIFAGQQQLSNEGPVQDDVSPKPYPAAFEVSFVTNITRNDNKTNEQSSDSDNNKDKGTQYPILSRLYYDSTIPAQRVDHGSGSFECLHFYQHAQPCSLYFFKGEGMYRILHNLNANNNKQECCLDLQGVGPPPRDWASRGNATYAGSVVDDFSGLPSREWIFHPNSSTSNGDEDHWPLWPPFHRSATIRTKNDRKKSLKIGSTREDHVSSLSSPPVSSPADKFHTSRQTLFPDEGTPLLFTFPGSAQGRQDYRYLVGTMNIVDALDPNLFDIPASCRNVPCDKTKSLESNKL